MRKKEFDSSPLVSEKYQSRSEYNFLVVFLAWHISIRRDPSCAEIRLSAQLKINHYLNKRIIFQGFKALPINPNIIFFSISKHVKSLS